MNRRGYEGYKRTDTDGRDAVACSCGITVVARGMRTHKQSVLHRQGKRLRALLGKPCLTLEVIAERVGVTRQRVHQLANKIDVECGPRQQVCTTRRINTANNSILETNRLLVAITALCAEKEFALETIKLSTRDVSRIRRNVVLVNGRLCHLRLAQQHRAPYLCLRPPVKLNRSEVVLYLSPDNQWMVIPGDEAPKKTTSFSMAAPASRKGNPNHRHNWRNYIEAWDLLATKTDKVAA